MATLFRRGTVRIVGAGKISQLKYLPFLAERFLLENLHVLDSDKSLASRVSTAVLNGGTGPKNGAELPDCPPLLLILNHAHADALDEHLTDGARVLIEKPVAWSTADAQRMFESASAAQAGVYPAFMRRHDSVTAALKQHLLTHAPPRRVAIRQFAGRARSSHSDIKPDRQARTQIKQELAARWQARLTHLSPLGAKALRLLLELLIHDIDLVLHLFGGPLELVHLALGETEGTLHMAIELTAADGLPIHIDCMPMFSAPWNWDHTIDTYFADHRVSVAFSNPFHNENTGQVQVYVDQCTNLPIADGLDPFSHMLGHFLDGACTGADWTHQQTDCLAGLDFVHQCEAELVAQGHGA
ncbi:MAG: Gfo/Idh/MocA family oxidoreductase [Paracoccaceae bacterium]